MPKIYKKYTPKIYFRNIFDGEKYTGNILKNILKGYDEKYFKNLFLLPSFGTINIKKYIFFWYFKTYNKNTGQMQNRKNMTKIY